MKKLLLILVLALVALPAHGATSLFRLGENRFLLTHSSGFSSAGGGAKGIRKSYSKAAALCHLLHFEFVVVGRPDQEKDGYYNELLGSTEVACYQAKDRPATALAVAHVSYSNNEASDVGWAYDSLKWQEDKDERRAAREREREARIRAEATARLEKKAAKQAAKEAARAEKKRLKKEQRDGG